MKLSTGVIIYALLLTSSLLFGAEATSLRGSDAINRPAQAAVRALAQADQVALYLIKETEGGGNDNRRTLAQGNRSDRTDNIQLPDGIIYEVKNAQAGWASNLKSGADNIRIPPGAIISTDGTIDMKGQKPAGIGKNLFNRNLRNEDESENDTSDIISSSRQLQSGTRTVLAVRVLLNDGSYSYASQTGLSDDIFGNGVDPYNLKSQYAACSYNQIVFDKTSDRSMSTNPNDGTTSISAGVVDVKVDLNITAGGDSAVRNAVTAKINSVFGVTNPNQLANHVMYCLPPGVMNGIAYAYINSWNSVYSNDWCNYLSTQMHEIGHNLGYAHSNEGGTTYADQTGMMGYSYGQDDGPVMCFNAAKSWQTQWYASKSIVVDPSAGNCFENKVYGIADYGNAASSTVLVKIDDASATDYYVTFNRQSGINSGTVEAGNQVTIVQAGGEGTSYAESSLLAKLSAGGSWSGVVDGKTMVVNVLSINTVASPAYAQVRISENGLACVTTGAPTQQSTPQPTPLPTVAVPTGSPTHQSTPQPTPLPTVATPLPTSKPTAVCLQPNAPITCSTGVNSKCCTGQCYKSGSRKNTCK